MRYASRQDLEHRYGAEEIARLAGDDDQADARIGAALDDATAEIDAVLAMAYVLPLEGGPDRRRGPWPALVTITCQLARARLYDDAAPEAVSAAAGRARRFLAAIADGSAALLDASDNTVPRRTPVPVATGPKPVMTAEALRGF